MKSLEMKFLWVVLCLVVAGCGGSGGAGDNDCIICAIPANQAPTAEPVSLNLAAAESFSGIVKARDPEGDPITFRIEYPPTRGDLRLSDAVTGAYTYTAPGAFASEDSFRLRVRDNQGNSSYASFTVRISGAVASGTCAISAALLDATPRQIVVHPRDPSRIAVLTRDGGNYSGVHTSRDGGATWLRSDTMRELDVVKLAFHPTRHGTLFAAVSGLDQAGIKRSDDHGATWRTRLGVEAHDVRVLWHSPGIEPTVWAATANGLHRSDDNGQSWDGEEISREFVSVAGEPGRPRVAYASTHSGLFRTSDEGSSDVDGEGANSNLTYAENELYSLRLDALTRTALGFFQLGATEHLLGSGAAIPVVLSDFAVDPGDADTLFVIESGRLMTSTDMGVSWSYVAAADSLGPLTAVAVSNEGTVYVGTMNEIACLRL